MDDLVFCNRVLTEERLDSPLHLFSMGTRPEYSFTFRADVEVVVGDVGVIWDISQNTLLFDGIKGDIAYCAAGKRSGVFL